MTEALICDEDWSDRSILSARPLRLQRPRVSASAGKGSFVGVEAETLLCPARYPVEDE